MKFNLFLITLINLTFITKNYADLVSMNDTALKYVDGTGIGIVLEDFLYNAGSDVGEGGEFVIGGLAGSQFGGAEQEAKLNVTQFYVSGSGSENGTKVENRTVNIGRLLFPFNIELLNGNNFGIDNKAVLELSAPQKNEATADNLPKAGIESYYGISTESRTERGGVLVDGTEQNTVGSRVSGFRSLDTTIFNSRTAERPDIGISFAVSFDDEIPVENLGLHLESVAVDGSYLRLWGDSGALRTEFSLNIYTDNVEVVACDGTGGNCGDSVTFDGFSLEAEFGAGDFQPVTFEVIPGTGANSGNFIFEVASIAGQCAIDTGRGSCMDNTSANNITRNKYIDYYENGPAINAYIENVNVGGSNFGSTTISNLQFQYLKVETHNLQ
jgi:hypothetical protein